MSNLRTTTRIFRKASAAFLTQGRQDNAPCWLCGQPIDYNAKPGTTPDSHNLDHYYPVSTNPELQHDPSNFRHAHKQCNEQRGNRRPHANLGQNPPAWW
ncbi:hypothetical protein HHJ78_10925 [Mobiluncus mulieris]|uniref:HNH domain-containing protein n=1 Tax=Mobiluncus mulieris TaxID=2052 RepID=A0A7Y0U366_9ACTO|nr:HNH endonuclease [Mobiluncus mulieris]NMW65997.1 hypothetical protein [Mobiluncus mulieris]